MTIVLVKKPIEKFILISFDIPKYYFGNIYDVTIPKFLIKKTLTSISHINNHFLPPSVYPK
jgi:hypothetical protein